MLAIQLEAATGSSKTSTTSGAQNDEPLVRDVTLEMLGERRAEWRDGFESGIREGSRRVLQSDAMQQIAFELKVLRVLYEGVCAECERRQREMLSVNRVKADALSRVVELARKLDAVAPGWDRVSA